MRQTAGWCGTCAGGLLLLILGAACSGKSANGDGGTASLAGAGSGAANTAGASGGSTASDGGARSDDPRGGSAGSVAIGGSTNAAGETNDAEGGDSSAGSAGEGPLEAVAFVLLEPPAPPSTPDGLTPDDERNFSTSYCCASADAAVIVGSSTYLFPRFSAQPSGELTRGFIWRKSTGLKDLGPISDPQQRFVDSINPEFVTPDGSRVLGHYMFGEPGPGGNEPAWNTYLGGFFVWTEAQGYTRIGPPDPAGSGYIAAISADGKTAIGSIRKDANSSSVGFLWTEANGFSLLKDLPAWPAEGQSYTLSRDGSSILGVAGESGFLWRRTGLQWLGTVGIWPVCLPEVMSADGAVIAGYCRNGSQPPITFRWTQATGMVAIDLNSSVQVLPAAISEHGDVVVGREYDATGIPAVLQGVAVWESGAGMRQVAPSADLGSNYMIAPQGITADGSAAIGTRLSNTRTSGDFQWTKAGGVRDLPSLVAPASASAVSQSKDGRLVAGSSGRDAVLWDAAGVRGIAAELRAAGVDVQGWDLTLARGVVAARSITTYGNASKTVPTSTMPEERVWIAWLGAR